MNNKQLKVGIVGFRFPSLSSDPYVTMLNNPIRSWALFDGLEQYNIRTYLYVGQANINESLYSKYGKRFISDQSLFVDMANNGDFDAIIFVGTKIHKLRIDQPWINEITYSKIFCAICADSYSELREDKPIPFPNSLMNQLIGLAFVSPYQKAIWDSRNTNIPSLIMTTGQMPKPSTNIEPDGSVVFMGHFHEVERLNEIGKLALHFSNKNFHIISAVFGQKNCVNFNRINSVEREDKFKELFENTTGFKKPSNLIYHFLPPGKETEILERASFALDFGWHWAKGIDSSKVANYLTWGLIPIVENRAPSYRFIQRFGIGKILAYRATWEDFAKAIEETEELVRDNKNRLRNKAGHFFCWDNLCYEVGGYLRNYFDQANALEAFKKPQSIEIS